MSSISRRIQSVSDKMADRIRSLRMEKGISNNELSQRSGLSRAAIRKIEQSDRNPTLTTLLAISEALNIPCWKIMQDAEEAVKIEKNNDQNWFLPKETEELLFTLRKKCKDDPDYASMLTKVLNLKMEYKKARTFDGQEINTLEIKEKTSNKKGKGVIRGRRA